MKIILCLLAIFVIGNCQNGYIDKTQDVDDRSDIYENSDVQERSEDEVQDFDSEESSNIEERSDDIDEEEDIDDVEDMEVREKRPQTGEDEEIEDMEEEPTIEERSDDADEKIEHIKTTNAILKNLEKQLAEGKKIFWNQINACGKEKNVVPFAQCNKCWHDCRGNKILRPLKRCDCDSVCKTEKREFFAKGCTVDVSEITGITKLIKIARKAAS